MTRNHPMIRNLAQRRFIVMVNLYASLSIKAMGTEEFIQNFNSVSECVNKVWVITLNAVLLIWNNLKQRMTSIFF